MKYPQFVNEFKVACSNTGLNFDLVPYQMRHSGPSADRALGLGSSIGLVQLVRLPPAACSRTFT